jgi:uncharacterized membrane-anchored protein YhcB (DUF1043 family)
VRRNWFTAAIVLGVVAIVIAAVAMRLSDDEPPTTAEWTESVCSSLVDWRESITSLADVSGEPLTADSLRDRLDDADAATSELVTELRDLGPPDLEAGDELQEQLDESIGELESSFDSLQESAEEAADAPASELAGLASDFAALQDAIGSTASALENANVAEESKAELQQAFADTPSCQSLQADS